MKRRPPITKRDEKWTKNVFFFNFSFLPNIIYKIKSQRCNIFGSKFTKYLGKLDRL
jgi:hypothetical protein